MPRSLRQIQNQILNAYRMVLINFREDQTEAGQAIQNEIGSFLVLPHPTVRDMLYLKDQLNSYKDQLQNNVKLFFATDYLFLKISSAINEIRIGDTNLASNLDSEEVNFNSYGFLEYNFRNQIANLNGNDVSFSNIVNIILSSFNSSANMNLFHKMVIDYYYYNLISGNGPEFIQSCLSNTVSGNDYASIITSIFKCNDFISISTSPIADMLFYAISGYLMNNLTSNGLTIANNIATSIANRNINTPYAETIAQTIVSQFGASDNFELIDLIEGQILYYTVEGDETQITTGFTSLINTSDFIDNNVHSLVAEIIKELQGDFYANKGPYDTYVAAKNYLANNPSLTLDNLVNNVKSILDNLAILFDKLAIANNVAQLFYPNNYTYFANTLAIDFMSCTYDANTIATNLAGANHFSTSEVKNSATFSLRFYQDTTGFVGFNSSSYSMVNMANAISDYITKNGGAINDVGGKVIYAAEYAISLPSPLEIVKSISRPFNASNNLINSLEMDFLIGTNDIKNSLLQIFYYLYPVDLLSFISTFYGQNIFPSGYISNNEVVYELFESFSQNNYLAPAVPQVTLSKALGYILVGPRAGIYLNKCSLLSQNNFQVGGSVFAKLDLNQEGPLLTDIPQLKTITGILQAISQCNDWVLRANIENLYITTSSAGSTSGNADATGCFPVLIPAIAMAYCDSVFDKSIESIPV